MAVDPQVRALARRIATLERGMRQRKQPQLAFSSIDGGNIPIHDDEGNLVGSIGPQGVTAPNLVYQATVTAIEAEIQDTRDLIASGNSATDQAIQDTVADYTARFGTVDDAIDNAITDYTSKYETVDNKIDTAISDFNTGLAARPKKTESTSAPGTTPNVAGEIWERYDNLGITNRKLLGAWRGLGGTGWVSVSLDPVYIPQLDVNTGTFGTIGVERLLVSAGRNLVVNPGFESGVAPHYAQNGPNPPSYAPATQTDHARSGAAFIMRLGANAGTRAVLTFNGYGTDYAKHVRVTPGQIYRVSAYVRMYGTQAYDANLVIAARSSAAPGSDVSITVSPVTAVPTSGAWVRLEGEITIPAGADFMFGAIQVSATTDDGSTYLLVDDVAIEQRMGGELIVDGTIYGKHIAATSIGAEKLLISDVTNVVWDWNQLSVREQIALPTGAAWSNSPGESMRLYRSAPTTSTPIEIGAMVPAGAGDQFAMEIDVYKDTATWDTGFALYCYNSAGVDLGTPVSIGITDAGTNNWVWTKLKQNVTLPSGTRFIKPMITNALGTGGWYYRAPKVCRKFGGELIVDGTIYGNHIASNSIGVEKLLVSDFTDLLKTSGKFATAGEWVLDAGMSLGADPAYPSPLGTSTFLRWTSTGSNFAATRDISTETFKGQYVALTGKIRHFSAAHTAGNVEVGIWWYNGGTYLGATSHYFGVGSVATDANTWYDISALGQAPDTATLARVFVFNNGAAGGTWDLTDLYLRRRFGGELIVDGSILARHVTADMVRGLLFAPPDGAGNAVFQTSNSPTAGIKITTAGLIAYGDGVAKSTIDSTTGRMTAIGGFSTASGWNDVLITAGTATNDPAALRFYSVSPTVDNNVPAGLNMTHGTWNIGADATYFSTLNVQGPKYANSSVRPRIDFFTQVKQANLSIVKADITYHAGSTAGGGYMGQHHFYIDGNIAATIDNYGLFMGSGRGLSIGTFPPAPANGIFTLGHIKSSARMESDGGFFDWSQYNGGYTGASFNNEGRLVRTASARKFKKNIRPMTLAEAQSVTAMEAVTFEWRKDMKMGDRRVPGFIANQAHDAGAVLWTTYANDDETDEPLGVRYPEVTAAHNVLIKDLRDRDRDRVEEIARLTERVAMLEGV